MTNGLAEAPQSGKNGITLTSDRCKQTRKDDGTAWDNSGFDFEGKQLPHLLAVLHISFKSSTWETYFIWPLQLRCSGHSFYGLSEINIHFRDINH